MMKSISIFLLSVVINFVIFATVIDVTASHDRRAKSAPVPVRFVRIKRAAPVQVAAPEPSPVIKKEPEPIREERKIKTALEPPSPEPIEEIAEREKVKNPVTKVSVEESAKNKKPLEVDLKPSPEPIKEVMEEKVLLEEVTEESVEESALLVEGSNIRTPLEVAIEPPAEPVIETKVLIEEITQTKVLEEEANIRTSLETPLNTVTKFPRVAAPIRPVYPERARRQGKEGTVELELLIDSTGDIIETRIVKSAGVMFDEAALDAIKRAEFMPALIGKRPVTVRVTIPIKFELE